MTEFTYLGGSWHFFHFCYILFIGLLRDRLLSNKTLLNTPEAQALHCKTLFTKYFWHSARIRDSHLNFMTQKPEAALKFLGLEGTSKCHHKFYSYAAGTSSLVSISVFWQRENPLSKHRILSLSCLPLPKSWEKCRCTFASWPHKQTQRTKTLPYTKTGPSETTSKCLTS